ncbi:helix-turn-helix transcriptional regulator [Streptomyces beigongshangae]|uniref:helix-turn-helix transcriptional regulator n=1 Tax=Streptomyces beigongshangae TaxID=2841597 RepID=UPI0027E047B1|nr:response regulator transcription factor [Streptomyces sp. REN17]
MKEGHSAPVEERSPAEERRRIPVVVHAPDPILREGTVAHLRRYPEVDLVGEAAPHGDGVAVLLAESIDQALLSQLRRMVRSEGLRPVLVIGLIREAELLDVIESGVGAIVWRHEATGSRLLRAVTAAFHGEGDLPSDLLSRLMSQVKVLRPGAAVGPAARSGYLTPREIDVLRLISEGMDTNEIAGKLSYSERTIKSIMQGLTTRMNLRNRAHAVAYAMREGYIS